MIRTTAAVVAGFLALAGCTSAGAPTAGTTDVATSSATTTDVPGSSEAAAAPPIAAAPTVVVEDQAARGATVTVAEVVVVAPAFVVIHRDEGGAPGPVIGHVAVSKGASADVEVPLDEPVAAGDVLWAMLHTDAGEPEVYEFPGPDVPLRDADEAVVMTPFAITS